MSDAVFNSGSGHFNRDRLPCNRNHGASVQPQPEPTTTGAGGMPSTGLALNEDVINEILAATRALPSWKACQLEGTSWTGTAEENIEKYISTIGVDDC